MSRKFEMKLLTAKGLRKFRETEAQIVHESSSTILVNCQGSI
jgi:hypothetical protein